jgi:peptidoglycan/LPS O-acetylase OafA/YrhL
MHAQRLPQLDGLTAIRGLAAWWVVFSHFTPFLYDHLPLDVWWLAKKGFLAVDLFFILSGFVIYYTYHQTLVPTATSVRNFLIKRLARVYPLHLLFLLAYLGFAASLFFLNGEVAADDKFSPKYFLLQLGLAQTLDFSLNALLSWNYPAWSISAELFAYLLFPPLLFFLKPQRWQNGALVMAIIGLIGLVIAYYFALGICPTDPTLPLGSPIQVPQTCTLNRDIQLTALPRCIAQFSIGICLCILFLRTSAHRRNLGLFCLIGGLVVLAGGALLRWDDVYFVTFGWTLLVFGIACEPAPVKYLLCNRPLLWLGEISYATYMCHALIRDMFKLVFVQDTGNPMVPYYAPVWSILVAFLVILLTSWAVYRVYERKSQKWIQNRFLQKPALS